MTIMCINAPAIAWEIVGLFILSLFSEVFYKQLPSFWSQAVSVVWSREVVHILEVRNTLDVCYGAFWCVHSMEVVHSSEGPLREVLLYTVAQVCALETYIYIPCISQCGCPCSSLPVPPRSVTRRQTSGPLDTHHSSSDSLQTREGWQRCRNTFMKPACGVLQILSERPHPWFPTLFSYLSTITV